MVMLIRIIAFLVIIAQCHNLQAKEIESLSQGGVEISAPISLFSSIKNAPYFIKDEFAFEILTSLSMSKDLYQYSQLSREDRKIKNYDYFNKEYNGNGTGAISMHFRGFGVSYFKDIDAEANINNPVYPNGDALIKESEGFVIGYNLQIYNLNIGISNKTSNTNVKTSSADVLEYDSGVIENEGDLKENQTTLGAAFRFDEMTIYSSYKNIDNSFSIGSSYNNDLFDLFIEGRNIINKKEIKNITHLGGTLKLSFLHLMVGLNQFYPTYGVGIHTRYMKINAGSFESNRFQEFRDPYQSYGVSVSFGYNL